MSRAALALLAIPWLGSLAAAGGEAGRDRPVLVAGGAYRPVTAAPNEPARDVAPFRLDPLPVTNAAFLTFVRANPGWRRDQVPPLMADAGYLAGWTDAQNPGAAAPPHAPVVGVSWFAARAYCTARGGRLPTEAEWELAAAATPTERDGRRDARWRQTILDWYARPNPAVLRDVGRGPRNFWGAADLHGLVWEWVEDFAASIVTEKDGRFCGAGASNAPDPLDYPAFLRAALRSSLEARTTTANLGFRCAYEAGATGASAPPAPRPDVGSIYDLDLRLAGADGHGLDLARLRGHPVVAGMFFAACPSACPLLIRDLRQMVAALPARAQADLRILLVSFDPARDTPAVLADVLRRHGLDWDRWLLAAPADDDGARVAAAALGIRYRRTADGQFEHTRRVTLLDAGGHVRAQSDDLRSIAAALQASH